MLNDSINYNLQERNKKMNKEKLAYDRADIEILMLSSADIICASGDDDMSNVEGDGWT